MNTVLGLITHGLLDLVWWKILLWTLFATHVTIASVTIYLHRAMAHRALDLHPAVSHFFRFWLWLTTGMITKVWVAIHRKHHARCETEEDPHSPQMFGIRKVFLEGSELYRAEAKVKETLEVFGKQTPDDFIERHLYTKYSHIGVLILLAVDLLLFGLIGLTVWAVQMLWIPVCAAGVINGFGHYFGYRNFDTEDASTNVSPWGVVIGGEELHNNHHAYPTSAKFSIKFKEFDIGWEYIRALAFLRLAKVKHLPPYQEKSRIRVDGQTAELFCADHGFVSGLYRTTQLKVIASELKDPKFRSAGEVLRELRKLLKNYPWNKEQRKAKGEVIAQKIAALKESGTALAELSIFPELFHKIRDANSTELRKEYLASLEAWVSRMMKSSIPSLRAFAERITRTVKYRSSQ